MSDISLGAAIALTLMRLLPAFLAAGLCVLTLMEIRGKRDGKALFMSVQVVLMLELNRIFAGIIAEAMP